MYELHIANKNYSSWSLRPWVLMRELEIPFDERLSPFEPGSSWQAFRRVSPTGLAPTLKDGHRSVWDSLAIVEYLAERHRGVWPDDVEARAWARSAAAEMHAGFSALREICTMNIGLRVRLSERPPRLEHELARIDELWCDGLDRFGGPFLAGSAFGAVDAFFAPIAFRLQTYGLTLSPPAQAYARRLLALPSMQAWQTAALAETWREPGHESEARSAGQWLQDLRATGGDHG